MNENAKNAKFHARECIANFIRLEKNLMLTNAVVIDLLETSMFFYSWCKSKNGRT